MLHVDIGITAMGMNTDTQHLGYILRANETSPPRSLVRGLHRANRMQDMNRREMVPGRTGDEVFFAVKRAMKNEGLEGDVYSHPIGDYGHSAGAIIGMANWQDCEWLSARVSLAHRLAPRSPSPTDSHTVQVHPCRSPLVGYDTTPFTSCAAPTGGHGLESLPAPNNEIRTNGVLLPQRFPEEGRTRFSSITGPASSSQGSVRSQSGEWKSSV
jgi:hypothetical protein